jgi:hypothetical protein
VPTNGAALKAFYYYLERIWLRTLRRRSQKDRFSWQRMHSWPPTGFPNRESFIRILTSVSPSHTQGGSRVRKSRPHELPFTTTLADGRDPEAFAIQKQLLSGSDASIEAMTERLGMGKRHLTSLVRLSYLAPDIVRALLEGRQPIELTATRLLRLSKDLPHDWSEQRHVLGFAA